MPVSGRFIRLELSGMKTGKSTGLDDVSTRFLKDGADSLIEPIKHIVKARPGKLLSSFYTSSFVQSA